MRTIDVSNSADVIDLRDVTDRYEELETELADAFDGEAEQNNSSDDAAFTAWVTAAAEDYAHTLQDAAAEFRLLKSLLEDLKGYGGDHQWRGDWYPGSMIRDSYFETYARDLAEDIGAVAKDATWPNQYIDWEAAAEALQADYSTVEYDGETFWYR